MNSMNNGNRTCFDSITNPLSIDARETLVYVVRLSNKGKVISIQIADNNYQILVDDNNGISKDEIGKTYEIDARNKTTDIISCNNSFLVEGEEGSGEENTPYKIQYIEDLVELSKNVENGETYAGKTIILSRDLDFKNKDSYKDKENSELYTQLTTGDGFNPIGKYNVPFSGTFDGKNHRIDNLYIHNTDILDSEVFSFIAFLKNGEVKNLTIQGEVTSDVKVPLGGIVGQMRNSTIDNCVNEITVTETVNGYAVGGIAGWNTGDATIKNSINKGNISGGNYTAGIIAGSQGGTLTIENCKNYGIITNEVGSYAGGILGFDTTNATKTIIKNSINYGEVKGKTTNSKTLYLGGLIGYTFKELEIDNSNNEGKITIDSNSSFYAGGLVGLVTGKADINNSHNKNTITSNKTDNIGGRDIGGLVGVFSSTQTSTITNSSNEKEGTINGGNRTGGLVGDSAAGLIMNNCYNLANINSSDTWDSWIHIGGLLGSTNGYGRKHEDIVILNSYNKGNIEVNIDNYSASGSGIVGSQIASNPANQEDTSTNTVILNSYNQGSITMNGNTTGSLISSGIMSITRKSVTLNNIYNIGLLNSKKDNYITGSKNQTATVNYRNVYYLNTLAGTKPNDTTNVIGKSADEMKNQSFVTLLNSNKNSITLTEIDSRLTGYTLCDWKLGVSSYPELDCK